MQERIRWEIKISPLKKTRMHRPIGLVVIVYLIALIFAYIYFGENFGKGDEVYLLIIFSIFVLLSVLFLAASRSGTTAPGFILDEEGIVNYTLPKKISRNKFTHYFKMFFGYLRGIYVPYESDAITYGRQITRIKWQDIRKAVYSPQKSMIIIYSKYNSKMYIFAPREIYEKIQKRVKYGVLMGQVSVLQEEI